MGIITARKCRDAKIRVVRIINSDLFWINTKDLEEKQIYLCCTNILQLIKHIINGYYDTKNPIKKTNQKTFDVSIELSKIYCHIVESIKKSAINRST